MLSMALAQHTGFILTWTQWQQSLPPGLALECHSISWHCIHYLLEWKGCHTHKPACAAAEGMWWAAVSGQDTALRTVKLYPARAHGTHRWALQLCIASAAKKREVFILNHKLVLYSVHALCLSPDDQWESGICLKLSLLWSAICSW